MSSLGRIDEAFERMCGIVGIVGTRLPDPRVIEGMTALLRHRGPDASGVWCSEDAQIGHTRLSILDVSAAGHQPMHAGSLVMTYNGEVYNAASLRRELPGPFRSTTDSEVVLHAFKERGPSCVADLNGMFAFAIWDQDTKSLFAARDPLGIKPLYYRPLDHGLAFASEVAPLLELGSAAVRRDALADYLTYGYIPTPKTAWDGIFKLPAGHTLAWQDGRLEIRRYWQLGLTEEIVDLKVAMTRTQELLVRTVADHSLSDVPVGVFLSSGVDSGAVAAFGPPSPMTFTMGQGLRHRDESGPARRLACHLGARHHEFTAEVPDLGKAAERMVAVFGEPFGDSAALSVWLLSRFVRQYVKVALSGEGGDEIFCGYRWYGNAMSRRPATLNGWLANSTPPLSKLGRSQQRRAAEGLDRYAAFLSVFAPRQVRALLGPWFDEGQKEADPLWYFRQHWRPELPMHRRLQWVDLHTYLPDDLLAKVDRASMAFSLEVRPPLLDCRMVEMAFGFSHELQRDSAADRGKVVLRRLLETRVPAGHLDLPKRGFNLPIARWLQNERATWKATLHRLEGNGVIRRLRPMSLTHDQAWALLVLDRWLVKYESGYGDSRLARCGTRARP